MNNEQLTAEVKALEQRLTELWAWGDLGRIGWNMSILSLVRETGDREQVDAAHGLDTELETQLATSYGRAIAEIDRGLPKLPPGPVLTVLLERLQRRLRSMGEHSFAYYLEREFQPNECHFNNETGTLSEGEVQRRTDEHARMKREAWQCVESSLSEYLGKVADHISAATAGTMPGGTTPLDRIRWNDTAALMGHLFHELEAAGYITPPQRAGQRNWSAVARTLHAAFDIRKEGGDPVTLAALTQALKPEGDRDIIGGKAAFKIAARRG